MKLCVLETGLVSEDIRRNHGGYPEMMERWLGPVLPDAGFVTVSAVNGSALPEPSAFDGYIITGSRHAVYEDHPWLPPLRSFLKGVAEAGRPMLGICFGHQLLAQTFGGTVSKSARGWGLGAVRYRLTRPVPGLADPTAALAVHQDQIVDLPPAAEVLAGNTHCPYGILRYAFPALSMQFHPEFTPRFVADLIAARGPKTFAPSIAAAARASFSKATDSARLAGFAGHFLSHGTLPPDGSAG